MLQDQAIVANTAKSGVSLVSQKRGRVGGLKEVLVRDDGVLTEGVVSILKIEFYAVRWWYCWIQTCGHPQECRRHRNYSAQKEQVYISEQKRHGE